MQEDKVDFTGHQIGQVQIQGFVDDEWRPAGALEVVTELCRSLKIFGRFAKDLRKICERSAKDLQKIGKYFGRSSLGGHATIITATSTPKPEPSAKAMSGKI